MEKSKVEKPSSKIYFSKEKEMPKEEAGKLRGIKTVSEFTRKKPAKTAKKDDSIRVIKLPRAYKPLRALDIDPTTGMPTLEEYIQAPHLLQGALPETKAKYQEMLRERQKQQAELAQAQLQVARGTVAARAQAQAQSQAKKAKAKQAAAAQAMTPRAQSPGISLPPPNATITEMRVFASQHNITIPSSITKKADIKAFIESQMGAGTPIFDIPPPPEFEMQPFEKGEEQEASESGVGTASGMGLKLKGRPRKEIADVMAGKDVAKHFKKFKALMKKESAGALTPIQSKRLESYKQLHAGGFFDTIAKVAKPLIKKGIDYALEHPGEILEFGTKYGPVAFDFLGKKKKEIFG